MENIINGEVDSLNHNAFFKIRTANNWLEIASKYKESEKLFGDFWREGEVTILFADTGQGKSVLSVQIADSISKGVSILGLDMTSKSQEVLYFDFENSDTQFKKRYTKPTGESYSFHDNFLRVTQNLEFNVSNRSYVEDLLNNIETSVIDSNAKVIIIDNITYINGDVEKAKDASELIKRLKKMAMKNALSVLIISHTPKMYDSNPIDINNLSGSKMIGNLVDGVFAIGSSKQGSAIRYLKQIKSRASELIYDDENVIICQLEQIEGMLQFVFKEFGNEYHHLKVVDRQERINKALELKARGLSNVKIARQLGVSEGAVRTWVK